MIYSNFRRCRRRFEYRVTFVAFLVLHLSVATSSSPSRSRTIITSIRKEHTKLGKRDINPLISANSLSIISPLRGGSTDPYSTQGGRPPYPPPPPQQQQQPQVPSQQDPYFDQQIPVGDENVPFQETFQDRIDKWREYQREHASDFQSNVTPRDEQGRMKLLTSVSKGSRAIMFFILMWRDVHLYETVDQSFKGTLRFMGVLPLTFLFVANMAGVVASITSPGHGSKKRLKAILNLDKLLEVYLILWSLARLVFSPSSLVPRELFITHILHSVFFIIQCQTVTRFVW